MRFLFPTLIILAVSILVELYAFQAVSRLTDNKYLKFVWLAFGVFALANFFITLLVAPKYSGQTVRFQWSFGMVILNLVPKLVVFLVLFSEDLIRVPKKMFSAVSSKPTQEMSGRRKFVSQLALGLAAIPFSSFLYGIIKGRYNYKVLKYQLEFEDLPPEFDGFTITQISDIHSGSFTNKEKIQYGVDLINGQKSDLMLFTGDIVNNKADEMVPWVPMFKELEAPYGKFSVLGNHDYGEYSEWPSQQEKDANFKAIKDLHPQIGFELLLNEHKYIEKNGAKIALVGVENWGKNFKQAGDLNKALNNIQDNDFKILMSHDPSHWEAEVKGSEKNVHLTLSGHTHGLQFGIEIPGFLKWSPSKYVYKYWAGLYQEAGRYLNVNRGFGYHAFPGRVGIWPEITVIELLKK